MTKRALIAVVATLLLGLGLFTSALVQETDRRHDVRVETALSPAEIETGENLLLQQDVIQYDNSFIGGWFLNVDTYVGVKFTPTYDFNLQTIYFAVWNEFNNTTSDCNLYVTPDDGTGKPMWPATFVGTVSAPLPHGAWIPFSLAGPIFFAAGQAFHVIYGLAPGGVYPGTGWWAAYDNDGTTTQRSSISLDNGITWQTVDRDNLIRAGGIYDFPPPGQDVLTWRTQPSSTVNFGAKSGDSLAVWFQAPQDLKVLAVRFMPINFVGNVLLDIWETLYSGYSGTAVDLNGWLSGGTHPTGLTTPLGAHVAGPVPKTISDTDQGGWVTIDIPTQPMFSAGENFCVCLWHQLVSGLGFAAENPSGAPHNFFKYYHPDNAADSPTGNHGWFLRSFVLWYEVVVEYTGPSTNLAKVDHSGSPGFSIVDVNNGNILHQLSLWGSPVQSVDILLTPDGSKAVVDHGGGAFYIIDVASGTIMHQLSLWGMPTPGVDVALTPDGTKAIVDHGGSAFYIIDLATGTILHQLNLWGVPTPGVDMALTPDGTKVVVDHGGSAFYIIDLATGIILHQLNLWGVPTTDVDIVITPDGTKAIVDHGGSAFYIIDIATGVILYQLNLWGIPRTGVDIALTPDGTKAVVDHSGSAFYIIDVATGTILHQLHLWRIPTVDVDIAITPDGTKAVVDHGGGAFYIIDITTGMILHQISLWGIPTPGVDIVLTPDGTKAVVDHGVGAFYIIDIATGTVLHQLSLWGIPTPDVDIVFTSDGTKALVDHGVNAFYIVDVASGAILHQLSLWGVPTAAVDIVLTQDDTKAVVDHGGGAFFIIDIVSGTILHQPPVSGVPIVDVDVALMPTNPVKKRSGSVEAFSFDAFRLDLDFTGLYLVPGILPDDDDENGDYPPGKPGHLYLLIGNSTNDTMDVMVSSKVVFSDDSEAAMDDTAFIVLHPSMEDTIEITHRIPCNAPVGTALVVITAEEILEGPEPENLGWKDAIGTRIVIVEDDPSEDAFLRVGDWMNPEPWYNWIGGPVGTTDVQLHIPDPCEHIFLVEFFYSLDGENWFLFYTDLNGQEPKENTTGTTVVEERDGWTGYFAHSMISLEYYGTVYFRAVAHTEEDTISVENARSYDPNPPSSVNLNIEDWVEIESETLFVDVDPVEAVIESILVCLKEKPEILDKGVPGIEQRRRCRTGRVEDGDSHCAPTAAAACLKYFERTGDNEICGGLSDQELVDELAARARTNQGHWGTYPADLANAIQSWQRDHGDNYTVRGPDGFDWKTMRDELHRCENVLVGIDWPDSGSHRMTLNSIINRTLPNGRIQVDFMDPWTGDIEWGNLDPNTGDLSDFTGAGPGGQLHGIIIVSPKKEQICGGEGIPVPGPDPLPFPIPIPHAGLWYLSVVVVNEHGNAYRMMRVVDRIGCGNRCDDNHDGEINVLDVLAEINIILDLVEPDSCRRWRADCNCDGVVNVLDPLTKVNCILGIIECPPCTSMDKEPSSEPAHISTPEIQVPVPEWERGRKLEGETGFRLPIHINTHEPIRGLQLNLTYDPSLLTPKEPQLSDRCTEMTLASNARNGELTVVLYDIEGKVIPAGGGPVFTLPFEMSDGRYQITDDRLRIEEVVVAGEDCQSMPVEIEPIVFKTIPLPTAFALEQNYPNPFNPNTDIRYQIADSRLPTHTTLKIYNILGQEIRTLVDDQQPAGYYTVTWDSKDESGREVASGIYFYQLSVEGGQWLNTKRMVLLR